MKTLTIRNHHPAHLRQLSGRWSGSRRSPPAPFLAAAWRIGAAILAGVRSVSRIINRATTRTTVPYHQPIHTTI